MNNLANNKLNTAFLLLTIALAFFLIWPQDGLAQKKGKGGAKKRPALTAAEKTQRDEQLKGLSEKYQGMGSFKAAYRRVTTSPAGEQVFKGHDTQVASGEMTWKKPAQLRLDQNQPQTEVMVTDGQTVWWHIPADKVVYLYKNLDVAGQMKPLLSFLDGIDALNASFEVRPAKPDGNRGGQTGLILVPLGASQAGDLDTLTVWSDAKFQITGFSLSSVTGEVTDFYLSGLNVDPKINEKQFKFKVPKGAKVVEESGE